MVVGRYTIGSQMYSRSSSELKDICLSCGDQSYTWRQRLNDNALFVYMGNQIIENIDLVELSLIFIAVT